MITKNEGSNLKIQLKMKLENKIVIMLSGYVSLKISTFQ